MKVEPDIGLGADRIEGRIRHIDADGSADPIRQIIERQVPPLPVIEGHRDPVASAGTVLRFEEDSAVYGDGNVVEKRIPLQTDSGTADFDREVAAAKVAIYRRPGDCGIGQPRLYPIFDIVEFQIA